MEQNPKPEPARLEDPLLLGEVLDDFFGMDPAAINEAIAQRQAQVRGQQMQHHSQVLRDALDARSRGDLEEGDDTIQTHREELWKLDAEEKGAPTDE